MQQERRVTVEEAAGSKAEMSTPLHPAAGYNSPCRALPHIQRLPAARAVRWRQAGEVGVAFVVEPALIVVLPVKQPPVLLPLRPVRSQPERQQRRQRKSDHQAQRQRNHGERRYHAARRLRCQHDAEQTKGRAHQHTGFDGEAAALLCALHLRRDIGGHIWTGWWRQNWLRLRKVCWQLWPFQRCPGHPSAHLSEGSGFAQIERNYRRLHRLIASAFQAIGARLRTRTDAARQLPTDEVQRNSIIGGVARHDCAAGNCLLIGGSPLGLAIVVWAIAAREKSQAG